MMGAIGLLLILFGFFGLLWMKIHEAKDQICERLDRLAGEGEDAE